MGRLKTHAVNKKLSQKALVYKELYMYKFSITVSRVIEILNLENIRIRVKLRQKTASIVMLNFPKQVRDKLFQHPIIKAKQTGVSVLWDPETSSPREFFGRDDLT